MPRGRFMNRPYESLINQGLFACLFDSNCNRNGHTDHGVVTSADETHHLCAVDALGELQSGRLFEKSYYIRLRELLNHKIIFAEHIVFGFAECIMPRFDVFANSFLNCLRKRCDPLHAFSRLFLPHLRRCAAEIALELP